MESYSNDDVREVMSLYNYLKNRYIKRTFFEMRDVHKKIIFTTKITCGTIIEGTNYKL